MENDPAFWGFCGVVVTGIFALLLEQIRNTRKTQDVLSCVEDVKADMESVKRRIDDHIKWHLTYNPGRKRENH